MTLSRIDIDLACRSCGYDLRGIAADGRCPECGAAALESVLERADAVAASLPPLDRPALAGAALVTTVASFAFALILLCLAESWSDPGAVRVMHSIAVGGSITTFAAAATLARRFGSRRRTSRRLLQLAAAAWCAVTVATWIRPSLPLGLAMAVAALLTWSMGRPLEELGLRSVRFRRQGPSRQGIGTLTIAAAISAASGLVHAGLLHWVGTGKGHRIQPLLLLESTVGGLACLGLMYLTANAVIIARSLGQEVLDPERFVGGAPPEANRPK